MKAESRRTKLLWLVLTALWLGVLVRLVQVQLVRHREYQTLARQLHWTKVDLLAERGRVLDCNNRPLTTNRSCCSIRILPQYARSKDTLAQILSGFRLGRYEAVREQLDLHDHLFWYGRRFEFADAESLRRELVRRRFRNCTQVDDDTRRVYPYGGVCASLLGFVGDSAGSAGIEAEYDSVLRGRPGWVLLQRDAIGYSYPDPSYPTFPPVAGADLQLTIDVDIQTIAYSALRSAIEESGALRGSAIVIDAHTGEIKALVDYPAFDPARYSQYPESTWRCAAVADEFEPGSSFKLVTLAAALESPNADEITSRVYDVSAGFIQIGKYKLNDAHKNGVLDFDSVFIQSSNVGCAMMSYALDGEQFYNIARGLGFANPLQLGLPYEGAGRLDRPRHLKGLRLANIAFGQGLTVTLAQLAAAYLCVANDGRYLRPYLIKSVRQGDRTLVQSGPAEVRQVLRPATASRMKDILRRVVTGGTGTLAEIAGFSPCGKTGTAQKVEGGKYSSTKSRMSFVGFFPRSEPDYVVAVLVDEPKTIRFAGTVCCPAFREIGERLIRLGRARESGQLVAAELAGPGG